jgi:hypothetical protein
MLIDLTITGNGSGALPGALVKLDNLAEKRGTGTPTGADKRSFRSLTDTKPLIEAIPVYGYRYNTGAYQVRWSKQRCYNAIHM